MTLAAFPSRSPTVVLIWARAILKVLTGFLLLVVVRTIIGSDGAKEQPEDALYSRRQVTFDRASEA
jgi:hypothetical protein